MMTILEKQYIEIIKSHLPQLEKSVNKMSDNIDRLIECLSNADI